MQSLLIELDPYLSIMRHLKRIEKLDRRWKRLQKWWKIKEKLIDLSLHVFTIWGFACITIILKYTNATFPLWAFVAYGILLAYVPLAYLISLIRHKEYKRQLLIELSVYTTAVIATEIWLFI